MDKYFVCLANSYKHGGRCIAGVEVVETCDGYAVVSHHGCPKWIRPVCRDTDAGAIPIAIAASIELLGIVRLTDVEPCPHGAQSENSYFGKLIPTGDSFAVDDIEGCFVDRSRRHLFYNYGKAVVPEFYHLYGDHSILLIQACDAEIYGDMTYTEYLRYRVRFSYRDHEYDLPITDAWYIQDVREGKKITGKYESLFITCSLGVEHDGWHPKLAACIIEPPVRVVPQTYEVVRTYSVEEIRETYAHAYAKWSVDDDAELGRLYDEGWTVPQLMEHFGRNKGGIRSRLKKIGKI